MTAAGNIEPPLSKPARREHVPLGIVYMLGATIVFAASSASSKWLLAAYPLGEVMFIRQVTSLAVCAVLILPFTGLAVFHTQRLGGHGARGAIQATAQTFLMLAFATMPLASAMAINFSSPLFATLLSALLLREAIGLARAMALLAGFCGVLIVTAPGADTFQIGALFAIANAVLYGCIATTVRGLSATETADTLVMYQMVALTILFTPLLLFGFTAPTLYDGIAMMLTGAGNAIGQYWWTRAISLAPTSAVTPFYYFALVWSMVLGFLVWGDVPNLGLIIGSAIVVASGLFLLWRETSRKPVAT